MTTKVTFFWGHFWYSKHKRTNILFVNELFWLYLVFGALPPPALNPVNGEQAEENENLEVNELRTTKRNIQVSISSTAILPPDLRFASDSRTLNSTERWRKSEGRRRVATREKKSVECKRGISEIQRKHRHLKDRAVKPGPPCRAQKKTYSLYMDVWRVAILRGARDWAAHPHPPPPHTEEVRSPEPGRHARDTPSHTSCTPHTSLCCTMEHPKASRLYKTRRREPLQCKKPKERATSDRLEWPQGQATVGI
ncbi:hypothetical protein B0H13DRAFT_1886250 [Mycena leptocephala]|nr:hypothetical protein B0H13DRAFT_1886250 [Mycena leptocephala]